MKRITRLLLVIATFPVTCQTTNAGTAAEWKAPSTGSMNPQAAKAADWWAIFGDQTLRQLLAGLDLATPQLAAAVQRIQAARAGLALARSDLYPSFHSAVGVGRSQFSQATAAPLPVRGANQWDAVFRASYEVDLWGRIRNNVRSARAAVIADQHAVEALRLSLRAELVDTYFALRGVEAELFILDKAVVTRKTTVELTQQRKAAGAGSDLEVQQARTDYLAAAVELSVLGQARMELENAIALVVGRNASDFSLLSTGELPDLPMLPGILPAELLRRRPDISEATHRIAAAEGQMKAARAEWFPTLNLEASGGRNAERLSRLDGNDARGGSIGFSLNLPLFDGGRRSAVLDTAKAAQKEGVEQQKQIVLTAIAEAETALGRVFWTREQHAQAVAAAEAATRSASLVSSKFAAGSADTFEQLLAERLRLDAARLKVKTQTAQLRAAVGLIRALGGGWND